MFSLLPEDDNELRQLQEQLRRGSRDSFQLLKNVRENPICSVTVNEEAQCIMVVWKQYATQVQLRFVHESLLALIRKHRVCKILGDDTALPTVPLEDQAWIVENWMPRAIGSGLRFIASKAPESYFGKLSIRSIQSAAPPDLEFRSFEEIQEARAWLQTVQAC
jgi:hypothetical protein